MENKEQTYQGGKKKSLWQVSISNKDESIGSIINVLANTKRAAQRDERVKEELVRLKLTTRTAKVVVKETCPVS